MKAYFDIQLPKDDDFLAARQIVKKYKDNSVDTLRFKSSFEKLEQQLKELDEEMDEVEDPNNLIPNIHSVGVNDQTGTLTIESSNISSLDIKYYLIDAEMLFSREPFLSQQRRAGEDEAAAAAAADSEATMQTFSFVKPVEQMTVQVEKDQTLVNLP